MQQIQIPPLGEGEVYLGGFVNANGDVTYTILLPGDNAGATWQAQMDWAKSIGGDLPTRAELLIAYEQHSDQFQQTAYWSNTSDDDPSYSGWAWFQYFDIGSQDSVHQCGRCRARAVRRVIVKGSDMRDAIERSKLIMALIDEYQDAPTATNRSNIRAALMDEFTALLGAKGG